jgi:phage terminase large subunit-like protein
LKIPFYDVVNYEQKDKRIHRLEPKVAHGWILFNENLSSEAHNQLLDYPYIDHDDFLDSTEMLYSLVHGSYKASAVSLDAMSSR